MRDYAHQLRYSITLQEILITKILKSTCRKLCMTKLFSLLIAILGTYEMLNDPIKNRSINL